MSGERTPDPFESPANRPGSAAGGDPRLDFGERLARIEGTLEHVANKEDIQKLRGWVLGGVLGALGLAFVATLGVARLMT